MPILPEEAYEENLVPEVDIQSYYLEDPPLEDYEPQELAADSNANAASPTFTPSSHVPEPIHKFLSFFYRKFTEKNVYELFMLYENSFRKFSEKFYAKESWPSVDLIAGIFNQDPIFLALYKELYYRHIHTRLQPTNEQRVDSFKNYQQLFQLLLDAASDLVLPNQWVWDILDEFIYQYQSYHFQLNKLKAKSDESAQESSLPENVWESKDVIGILKNFIEKSNIKSHLLTLNKAAQSQEQVSEQETPLHKTIGYFSLVSLLRVHVLLGEFPQALAAVQEIDLTKRGMYPRVISCHVAVYYYIGVSYLMTRKYLDAIKTFSSVLIIISRTKQFQTRVHQYDNITKKVDQMYALLTICISVWPYKLEDSTQSTLREKFGDQLNRIHASQNDSRVVFEDLFCYGSPKFIQPRMNPLQHHFNLLFEELKLQLTLCNMRGYLQLFKSIPISKLASYLEVSLEEARSLLVSYKLAGKNELPCGVSSSDPLILETPVDQSNTTLNLGLDFVLKDDVVYILENKTPRRYGDYFSRHIQKLSDLFKKY